MDVSVVLSTDEIVKGLKHYRKIAKQDILRAGETLDPERFKLHAETRRDIYAQLSDLAEKNGPTDAVKQALDEYKSLPFVTGTPENEYIDVKAKENALENFFLMIGLEPKIRREVRSQRPSMN
ncbi:MAG: hypothetical protein KC422_15665 [Trueperaceae bacterium]|nr:hypothetical protein [Trueperaceae bacterium]